MRLLLIEDDEDYAELYEKALGSAECLVGRAPDGQLGLLMARSWEPDLILLDVEMPQTDGIEVLRRLRAQPETSVLPVVILSNCDDPGPRQQGEELGALEWMMKVDTTPKDLVTWIDHWSTASVVEPSVRPSQVHDIDLGDAFAKRMDGVLECLSGLLADLRSRP